MKKINWKLTGYFSAWFIYFFYFWSHAIHVDDKGNLIAAHVNVWGDWTTHFTMGSAMAYRQLFLMKSPLLLKAAFSYPFFANFLSALLIRAGVPFFASFVWPSFIFSIAIVSALFLFYRAVFGSNRIAVIGSLLLLLNGGTGFTVFFHDVANSPAPLATLIDPPKKYTQIDAQDIVVPSIIDSMIIPQRGFSLGFPLALLTLTLVFSLFFGFGSSPPNSKLKLLTASLLCGAMPLIHTHSFLALFMVFACWAVSDVAFNPNDRLNRAKKWGWLAGLISLIALPLIIIFFKSNTMGHGFFTWAPGWYAGSRHINFFKFWIKNWGLIPELALVALVLLVQQQPSSNQKWLQIFRYLPFFILFAGINLFVFQPWMWDNTKLLAWASVGFSGLAAYAINAIWVYRRVIVRPFAVLIFVFSVFSGSIDTYRILRGSLQSNIMYSPEELYLTDWAIRNTPNNSIWLLGPRYHSWVANLTGRQVVLTHPTLLWSHGYQYEETLSDVRRMFDQPEDKKLFEKYGVDYIVVGNQEKDSVGASAERLREHFSSIIKTETYEVFCTKPRSGNIVPLALTSRPDPEFKVLSLPNTLPIGMKVTSGLIRTVHPGIYFYSLNPKRDRHLSDLNFHFDAGVSHPFPTPCSMVWQGAIHIPQTGLYEFYLTSDDGSWLYMDGVEVINNAGIHPMEQRSRKVQVTQGLHTIVLKYFDAGGGAVFDFQWKPPAGVEADLPSYFFSVE